jgi:hypothetical protein
MTALLLAALLAAPAAQADQQSRALPQQPDANFSRELSDDDIRETVRSYLGSIDTPITADRWRALGPRAAPVLEQIAQDHERLPTRRARALEGLSFVGSQRAPELMVQLAQRESEPAVVRMSAMRGAGRLLEPAKLLSVLQPVLTLDKNAHLRATAAEVLARRVPSAGCASVREQVGRETSEKRLAFARAVKACDASIGAEQ